MSYVTVNAGELNRLVTIKYLISSQDTFGQQIDTETTAKQVWAAIRPLGGSEQVNGSQINALITHEIITHYDSALDPETGLATATGGRTIIVYGGRRFYVDSVFDREDAKRQMVWQCVEIRN